MGDGKLLLHEGVGGLLTQPLVATGEDDLISSLCQRSTGFQSHSPIGSGHKRDLPCNASMLIRCHMLLLLRLVLPRKVWTSPPFPGEPPLAPQAEVIPARQGWLDACQGQSSALMARRSSIAR